MKRWIFVFFVFSIMFWNCSSSSIKIDSSQLDNVKIGAHLHTPSDHGKYPAIIVLPTIAGMQPHVTRFASKLSKEGYITLAVDYHSGNVGKLGYYPHIEDAYDFLVDHPSVDPERIGIVGFSLGPRYAFQLAANDNREIKAIVSYYVGRLHLVGFGQSAYPPTLFLHGEWDQETDPSIVARFCEAQSELPNPTICEYHIYKGVKHAFDKNTKKYRGYNSAASSDAYKRTVVFLEKYVKNVGD